MSNIEIVTLKRMFFCRFLTLRGKECQMYQKAFGKKHIFMSTKRILLKKSTFSKVRTFSNGKKHGIFCKTRNFVSKDVILKNP